MVVVKLGTAPRLCCRRLGASGPNYLRIRCAPSLESFCLFCTNSLYSMRSFIPLSLFLLLDLQLSEAVKLPFHVRYSQDSLTRRANSSYINVANTFNAEYISNITLGGKTIPVLLDTGAFTSHSYPAPCSQSSQVAATYGLQATFQTA